MPRQVAKEEATPHFALWRIWNPQQNNRKQRTLILFGRWLRYFSGRVSSASTCDLLIPFEQEIFEINLSQGRPSRFDQYLLHFLEYGSDEILCLKAGIPWLRKTGFPVYYVPPSLPIPRKPLNTPKNDTWLSNQGPLKCCTGGKKSHHTAKTINW